MEASVAPSLTSVLAFLSAPGNAVWLLVAYAALFGVRIGPKEAPWFQVHGLVSSMWRIAESVGVGVERLGRIETKLDKALGIEPRAPSPSVPSK